MHVLTINWMFEMTTETLKQSLEPESWVFGLLSNNGN